MNDCEGDSIQNAALVHQMGLNGTSHLQFLRQKGVKRLGTSAPDEQERTDHIRACLVTLDPRGAAALVTPDLSQRSLVKGVFGGQYNGRLSKQLKEAHSCRKQMDAHEWAQVWGWLHNTYNRSKLREGSVTSDDAKIMFEFWEANTPVLNNISLGLQQGKGRKPEWVKKRLGSVISEPHIAHIQDKPDVELWTQFQNEHAGWKFKFESFRKCRPFFVKPYSAIAIRNKLMCACKDCTVWRLTLNAYKGMLTQVHRNCTCDCDWCRPDDKNCVGPCQRNCYTKCGSTAIFEKWMCKGVDAIDAAGAAGAGAAGAAGVAGVAGPAAGIAAGSTQPPQCYTNYSQKCITGECDECGLMKCEEVVKCPRELAVFAEESQQVFKFEGFQYVPVIDKKTGTVEQTKGKKPQDKKRLEFVRENVCASIIRKRLQVEFGKYKVHKFASVFNGKNMQELIDRLPLGCIMVNPDWSENPTQESLWEIQSERWTGISCVFLTCPVVYHTPESTLDKPELRCDLWGFTSDDTSRDPEAWTYCLAEMLEHYRTEKTLTINTIWQQSDGCGGQFKAGRAQWTMSAFASKFRVDVHATFSAAGHGKSLGDAFGGFTKITIRKLSLQQSSAGASSYGFSETVFPKIEGDDDGGRWKFATRIAEVMTERYSDPVGSNSNEMKGKSKRAESQTKVHWRFWKAVEKEKFDQFWVTDNKGNQAIPETVHGVEGTRADIYHFFFSKSVENNGIGWQRNYPCFIVKDVSRTLILGLIQRTGWRA